MFTSELFIAHAKQNGSSVHDRKGGNREKPGADANSLIGIQQKLCLGLAR